MLDLFYQGGPLFMGILTILFIFVLISGWKFPDWTKEIGLLALTIGILGQTIGLYSAFSAIEAMGEVSQEIMFGGLKVSSITTIYGLIIYVIAILISLLNKSRLSR